MATEVVWTEPALEDLNQVFEYYRSHYSETSAVKIFNVLVDAADSLLPFPDMAPKEELLRHRREGFRALVQGHYKIIYYIENDIVQIAMIWDCRQNPIRLIDRFR